MTLGAVAVAGAGTLARALTREPVDGTGTLATLSPRPSLTAARSSPSPSPTPTPTRAKQALLIHGAGDTNLDPGYIPAFRAHGYEHAWSGLGGLFERDDLSLVNCECPVSNLGTRYPGKQFSFRGDPKALPAMKAAGVDVANLGNNHAYDYGPAALLDTRKNLLKHGIAPVGAGKDPAEANKAAMFDMKGWTIAVVGFDKVVDPDPQAVAAPGHPGTAGGHNYDAMVKTVKAAKKDADLLIVAIHWGVELDTQPRDADVALGHRFIDAGADIVLGSHSHRLQPMGVYKGRPIFFSLGNFVWPNFSTAGATTAIAEIKITAQGKFVPRLIPALITSPGHPVLQG